MSIAAAQIGLFENAKWVDTYINFILREQHRNVTPLLEHYVHYKLIKISI